jgi:predicted nucleic acid-binding protein
VIEHCYRGEWRWLTSDIVSYEVQKSPSLAKRERVQKIVEFAESLGSANAEDVSRGRQLEEIGFSAYDALHIACAERGRADVLLTTDDRSMRLGKRHSNELKVRIENPLTWLQEVL